MGKSRITMNMASLQQQMQWNQMMAKDQNHISKEISQLDHHQVKKMRPTVKWIHYTETDADDTKTGWD